MSTDRILRDPETRSQFIAALAREEAWPRDLTVAQAAKYTGYSPSAIERLISEKHIRSYQLTKNGNRRIDRDDLDAYRAQQKNVPIT